MWLVGAPWPKVGAGGAGFRNIPTVRDHTPCLGPFLSPCDSVAGTRGKLRPRVYNSPLDAAVGQPIQMPDGNGQVFQRANLSVGGEGHVGR